jgi:hypothetical protein
MELAEKRGGSLLGKQLAEYDKQLAEYGEQLSRLNLEKAVECFGHKVTRFNLDNDTISIKFSYVGENPEKRDKRRAKKLNIAILLAEILKLREKKKPVQISDRKMQIQRAKKSLLPSKTDEIQQMIDEACIDDAPNLEHPPQQHKPKR